MCPKNAYLRGRSCICAPGTYNISGICVSCPSNSRFDGSSCACLNGFKNISGLCGCPNGAYFDGRACTCNDGYITIPGGGCINCPDGAIWDGKRGCLCAHGFTFTGTTCYGTPINDNSSTQNPFPPIINPPTILCGANSQPVNGRCQCNTGYVDSPNGCVLSCPIGASLSLNGCVCNTPNTYLIGGACRACPLNSYYNGASCICFYSTYKPEQNLCLSCNPPAVLSGIECKCPSLNQVYIFDACYTCHQSCSTCSGTTENECLTCANQKPPVNGVCSQSISVCPTSTYFSPAVNSCQNCIGFCMSCQNSYSCQKCMDFFNLINSQCLEICGDGRKFQLPCDDGNLQNGDGCNSDCQIEQGWTCSGGNPVTKDNCTRAAVVALKPFSLSARFTYHVYGIIVVQVVLSYMPP